MTRAYFIGRSHRGFHWIPRVYPGINGCPTSLLVFAWWACEVTP